MKSVKDYEDKYGDQTFRCPDPDNECGAVLTFSELRIDWKPLISQIFEDVEAYCPRCGAFIQKLY